MRKNGGIWLVTSADQFKDFVASLTVDNGLGFSDVDLVPTRVQLQGMAIGSNEGFKNMCRNGETWLAGYSHR